MNQDEINAAVINLTNSLKDFRNSVISFNIAVNASATASTAESGRDADLAIDGDANTRWVSENNNGNELVNN